MVWIVVDGIESAENRERAAKEIETKMPLAAGADFTAETSLAIRTLAEVSCRYVFHGANDG